MSQLVSQLGFTMRVKGLHKSIFNISLVGFFFWGGGCMLLAGEMLKTLF